MTLFVEEGTKIFVNAHIYITLIRSYSQRRVHTINLIIFSKLILQFRITTALICVHKNSKRSLLTYPSDILYESILFNATYYIVFYVSKNTTFQNHVFIRRTNVFKNNEILTFNLIYNRYTCLKINNLCNRYIDDERLSDIYLTFKIYLFKRLKYTHNIIVYGCKTCVCVIPFMSTIRLGSTYPVFITL